MKLICTTSIAVCLSLTACGSRGTGPRIRDDRPLESAKALPIIDEILADRGYTWETGVPIRLTNGTRFNCDRKINNEPIAIEFLSEDDRRMIGPIPPAAAGSRLHVVTGRISSSQGGISLYVYFIDARKFVYQVPPSSEDRADVSFLEVDSRLRRDLTDFISWHENSKGKR